MQNQSVAVIRDDIAESSADSSDEQSISLFSMRRPRDAAAGLSSALKNVGKGVLAGVGSLVSMPVAGAMENGAKGFAKGLACGAVAAVALPAAGVATGAVQIVRGVANTPEAVRERLDDKMWHPEKRIWYSYSLPDEAAQVKLEKAEEAISSDGQVADTELYDALGVEPSATRAQIKKAYYLRARTCHPDKNPDDPLAKEKFQKVGAAYQVLMDENLRAAYDQKGKDGIDGTKLVDSAQLMAMVFGSERFESLVGELRILAMHSAGLFDPDDSDPEDVEAQINQFQRRQKETNKIMAKRQLHREVQCALNLLGLIGDFVSCKTSQSDFKEEMVKYAKDLASTKIGSALVGVIGYIYVEESKRYLGFKHGLGHGLGVGKVKKTGHSLASKYRLLSSFVKTYQITRRDERNRQRAMQSRSINSAEEQNKPECSDEKRSSSSRHESASSLPQEDRQNSSEQPVEDEMISEDCMVAAMNSLWLVTVADIESTIRVVCKKLLKDSSVTVEEREKRAKALLIVGTAFHECGQSAEHVISEILPMFVPKHPHSTDDAEETAE